MSTTDVVIREAEVTDMPALLRLADLDSRGLPDGRLIVAEVGGEIVAALGTRGGSTVADPFVPTAELRELLELRAAQMEHTPPHRHGLLGALATRRA